MASLLKIDQFAWQIDYKWVGSGGANVVGTGCIQHSTALQCRMVRICQEPSGEKGLL